MKGYSISMKKVRVRGVAVSLILCLLLCLGTTCIGHGDEYEEQRKKASLWVWERLKNAYSIYSSLFSPTSSIGNYWHMLKAFLSHTYALFFPPNIERGDKAEGAVAENGGAGEKVKEAITKSIGKTKASLEDVAKSAANLAKDKVVNNKRSFSNSKDSEQDIKPKKEL